MIKKNQNKLYLIFATISLSLVAGINQEKQITRVEKLPNLPGNSSFDFGKYEHSLLRSVEPAPVSTLVEVLYDHSSPIEKIFAVNLKNAALGKSVIFGSSYEKRAQEEFNILIQDFMPMNEADTAAALLMFNLPKCSIRKGKDKAVPPEMTACQYNGSKILAGIIKRLQSINSVLILANSQPLPGSKKVLNIVAVPEVRMQTAKIISLLDSEEYTGHLSRTDPTLVSVWNDIKLRLRNPISTI